MEGISIHAPRTGSDHQDCGASLLLLFQSTLPARGATECEKALYVVYEYFNPRSPHGERRAAVPDRSRLTAISIHAPRTGSDPGESGLARYYIVFQSTLPARGATRAGLLFHVVVLSFQSTLPARGATEQIAAAGTETVISIHAPRTGSD